MKRKYRYVSISELPAYCSTYEQTLDKRLLINFLKCSKWIKENCPTLNGEFRCKHIRITGFP
jgi:hypothetical protein